MSTYPYAELHCHTNFSFLDGAAHPEELALRAAELGYTALGITDHDGFRGVVKVHRAAQQVGLPVVYGTEVGMNRNASSPGEEPPDEPVQELVAAEAVSEARKRGRIRRMHGSKPMLLPAKDHLVLLAPDPAGYAAISRFVTRGQFHGRKDAPEYRYEELAEAARDGDLVALTGCHQGAVPRAAAAGDLQGALDAASRLRELFPGRLFVELWHHGMPEDDARNDMVAHVAERLRLPTVATNNVHYTHRSDAYLSEVLAAIGGRRNLDKADGFRPATDERHLKSGEEMTRRFSRYRGAVARAAELGRSLAFDLDLLTPRLPDFPMPGGFISEDDYLGHIVTE